MWSVGYSLPGGGHPTYDATAAALALAFCGEQALIDLIVINAVEDIVCRAQGASTTALCQQGSGVPYRAKLTPLID
jgi:hypothetical protein